MINNRSLIRLQAWLSPSFTTGAFSYSHGLEAAIEQGLVKTQDELTAWLEALVIRGSGWNDAVLLAESWRLADRDKKLDEIIELAEAMAFSKERHLETMAQGEAFLSAARAWNKTTYLNKFDQAALPVAVGGIASLNQVDLEATLASYLHSFISNQIQAALRLMPLGQQAGLEILSRLEETLLKVAEKASKSTIDELGSASFMADIMGAHHEIQTSRIFRS